MSAKAKEAKEAKKRTTNEICTKVGKAVLDLLGKPPDFWKITVTIYSEGRARANIWCQENGSPRMPHPISDSFYLHLSRAAEIESSSPPIKRRY